MAEIAGQQADVFKDVTIGETKIEKVVKFGYQTGPHTSEKKSSDKISVKTDLS